MTTQAAHVPRYRVDLDVLAAIQDLAGDTAASGPAQVHRELSGNEAFAGRVPHLRTIQRIARHMGQATHHKEWRASDHDPADARIVLDVLGEVIVRTRGRTSGFRDDMARWVVRVSRMGPGLTPWEVYLMARLHRLYENVGGDVRALDIFEAMAPWRDADAFVRYTGAVEEGIAPPLVLKSALVAIGERLLEESRSRSEALRPGRAVAQTAPRAFRDLVSDVELNGLRRSIAAAAKLAGARP